jgi:hypothetical protein
MVTKWQVYILHELQPSRMCNSNYPDKEGICALEMTAKTVTVGGVSAKAVKDR